MTEPGSSQRAPQDLWERMRAEERAEDIDRVARDADQTDRLVEVLSDPPTERDPHSAGE